MYESRIYTMATRADKSNMSRPPYELTIFANRTSRMCDSRFFRQCTMAAEPAATAMLKPCGCKPEHMESKSTRTSLTFRLDAVYSCAST